MVIGGLNFHQLRVFYSVARTSSFSRASRELFISQPAVSVQVKALEEFFGLPLLQRTGRGVKLTEAGAAVFEHAQRIFNLTEAMVAAVADIKGLQAGRLTIASSTTPGDYLLPELIGRFKAQHPGIEVELQITNTPGILQRLLQHDVDLGFIGDPVEHHDIALFPFRQDEIVLFARGDDPVVHGGGKPRAVLEGHGLVLREKGSATRKWAEEGLHSAGARYRVVMELGSNEAVKRAVMAGLGLGMLSRYAVESETLAGSLRVLPLEGLEFRRWLYLAHHRRAHLTHAQKAFVRLALGEPGESSEATEGGPTYPPSA